MDRPTSVRGGTDARRAAVGAKVIAAGACWLGGAALWPSVSQRLANLWRELGAP